MKILGNIFGGSFLLALAVITGGWIHYSVDVFTMDGSFVHLVMMLNSFAMIFVIVLSVVMGVVETKMGITAPKVRQAYGPNMR